MERLLSTGPNPSSLFLYTQCLFDKQKQTTTVVGILLLVCLLTYFCLFDHQKMTGNAIGNKFIMHPARAPPKAVNGQGRAVCSYFL